MIKKLMAILLAMGILMTSGVTAFAYADDADAESSEMSITAEADMTTDVPQEPVIDRGTSVGAQEQEAVAATLSEADIMELMGQLFSLTKKKEGSVGTVSVDPESCLNVRSGAGMDCEVISKLFNGEQVNVTGSEGDWYQITIPEQVGYVYRDYLNVTSVNEDGSLNITLDEDTMSILSELVKEFFSGTEETPALTPGGNLTLIDDVGRSTGAGKQFITLETKSGNYFYLIIDRDDKGEENVHFLNLVDEADLFALMDEEQMADFQAALDARDPDQHPETVTPETPEEPEAELEPEVEHEQHRSVNFMPLVLVVLLIAGAGGGFLFLQMKKREQSAAGPDPDADYEEEGDEIELPEEKYGEPLTGAGEEVPEDEL